MSYKTVVYEVLGNIAVIRLNRPERMNAVSEEMYEELITAFNIAEQDNNIRAVVLTGSVRVKDGIEKQAFCAGADLKKHSVGERTHYQKRMYIELAHRATKKIYDFPKPVIASVNGPARGAGSEMALNCDFIIMADDASIGFPEISIGTFVGGGVTKILPELVGIKKARELIYTGGAISGAEAVKYGLATASYPVSELMLQTMEFASYLACMAPLSMKYAKKWLNKSSAYDMETVLQFETDAILTCMDTFDWQEGIDAFMEKRKPEYKGE